LDIVDIHPHVISNDVARYPFNPVGGKMSGWSVERPADCDAMIAAMDAAGIRQSVLVHASTAYGFDNSYVADCAAAHPNRFRFIGALDVTAPDAVSTLTAWVGQRGMVGFRIFAQGSTTGEGAGEWLADPKTFPSWEAARAFGIPVCVQTRFGSFGMLATLLERFPDVRVIVDHGGYPPTDDGPPYAAAQAFFDLGSRHDNVYFKLTERNFDLLTKGKATTRSFLEQTIAAFGTARIAWGSNFPSSPGSLSALLALAKRELAFLAEHEQEQIFSGTALTLYPGLRTIA
jgi:predicted TIM-barrel fold metal-dependent hydrolase